jgi:hypothetical protein
MTPQVVDFAARCFQARRLNYVAHTAEGFSMERTEQSSWDRFQSMLENLQPGDEIHVAAASRESGLPPHTCEHVLEALARVDLFTRLGNHTFIRRRIFRVMEQLGS